MTTSIPGARAFAAVCMLALAGCGTEQAAPEPPSAPAAAAPASASPQAATAPAAAPAEAPAPASARRDAVPTRADSVAAAAEDVSPEWKQRERAMAGTEQCLRQAADLPDESRARVEAACRARPSS